MGGSLPMVSSQRPKDGIRAASIRDHDAAYFQAYSHIGVHEEMIKDRTRTDAYRDAIFMHADAIRDKVVVDVGCGTGILSIFCAYAGARKVYAVDASNIAVQAQQVVKTNGFSDVITVLVGRVEEVEIDEEVDVIVSEWMGYMLLYESMLSSVICARDRWLKPGGIILPSHATLYMAPITNAERYSESIDFWRNVYGIDMSAMLPLAKQCAFEEPCVESITGENVLSWPIVVKQVDCLKVTVQELEVVTAEFHTTSMMMANLHGFAFWFDVTFGDPSLESPFDSPCGNDRNGRRSYTPEGKGNECLILSTAPEESPTHWQQTILYIYDPIEVVQDQVISGTITLSQALENPRFLNIHLDYASGGRRGVKESVMR
jgi:protein arginine N-methyltransferase 6